MGIFKKIVVFYIIHWFQPLTYLKKIDIDLAQLLTISAESTHHPQDGYTSERRKTVVAASVPETPMITDAHPTSRAAVPYTHGTSVVMDSNFWKTPNPFIGPKISGPGTSGYLTAGPCTSPGSSSFFNKTVSGLLSQWIDIPVGHFTVPETMVSTPDIPYIM